jgi:UDP-glucose 4-epimerase
MSNILVTGAAGYIGTHTCIELSRAGYDIVAVDNFCNSKPEGLKRVAALAGRAPIFYRTDIRDYVAMAAIFQRHSIDAVIHFAGLKSSGESVRNPLVYYENNIISTINLIKSMRSANVSRIVFSSSATVYGEPATMPLREDSKIGKITSPYGRSKRMLEQIFEDIAHAESGWQIALLRYFNPAGAHESGFIGEDPNGIPNNLMPYISQVAAGKLKILSIFGGDYPTLDGTAVRDYIHVVDLASAHVKALNALVSHNGVMTLNLGTGQGYSVLDIVNAFSRACGKAIPYHIVARRPGDSACSYADPSLAEKTLDWKAVKTLHDICCDSWRWQKNNPNGYQ